MIIKNLLSDIKATGFFILDSHQDAMDLQSANHRHNDKDFESYAYNKSKYNKLKPGAFVLFRRPGKWSDDKRFRIYGGGIVGSIVSIDNNNNVKATIVRGFAFDTPIIQGDPLLESYQWKTRNKPGPGWKGFWVNYGMNRIAEEDYWWLLGDRTGELVGDDGVAADPEEYETVEVTSPSDGFQIRLMEIQTDKMPTSRNTSETIRKVNFDKVNKIKSTLGSLGETIVMEYEKEKLAKLGITNPPERVSVTKGDNLGYDIISYDDGGNEIFIEVKTTKNNNQDDFYFSGNELDVSRKKRLQYYIYRLYNLDVKKNTSDLVIFQGPINESEFDLQPVTYKVRKK